MRVAVLSSQAVLTALVTTNWIALLVTGVTLLAGYPIAYYLATSTGLALRASCFSASSCRISPASSCAPIPGWCCSAETASSTRRCRAAGLIDAPLPLLYNKLGVLIGMTYVLLPYMVLTLYAAMRAIDPSLVCAPRTGSAPAALYAFWRVYFPLSLHGVLSGSLIVFILAIGFFITPALMGGPLGRHDRDADRALGRDHARLAERRLDVACCCSRRRWCSTRIYYRVTDVRRMMGAVSDAGRWLRRLSLYVGARLPRA